MSEEVETCPPEQAEMSHRTLIDRRLGQEGSNGSILLPVDDSDVSGPWPAWRLRLLRPTLQRNLPSGPLCLGIPPLGQQGKADSLGA